MRTIDGRRGIAGAAALVALVTAACSGTTASRFQVDDAGTSDGFGSADGSPGLSGSNEGGLGSGGPSGLGSDQKACASSTSAGNLTPVNLVFMYDKSGSMVQPAGTTTKWLAAQDGVTSFVADPESAGMSATIEFFSGPKTTIETGAACEAVTYSTAAAGPIALPDTGGVIAAAIKKQSPNGGTASLYAMQGARAIASSVLTKNPGEKAVIVFVTDGDPDGCGFDNNVDNVAAEAAKSFTAGVPVYVIGVGNSLSSLNQVASSGGTSSAYVLDTSGNVSASLLAALTKIRGQVASCTLAIPAAPQGRAIDYNAVNVGFGGQTLSYSKDCASGTGWHYDDPSNPKAIDLCPTTCDDVKKTAGAQVSIALGCATKGGVIQ
jgi:hypothetical protein